MVSDAVIRRNKHDSEVNGMIATSAVLCWYRQAEESTDKVTHESDDHKSQPIIANEGREFYSAGIAHEKSQTENG